MKIILIRGDEPYHEILARELAFPPYYGNNLDALHDCLTEVAADTAIILIAPEPRLLRTLRAAAEDNPHLRVYIG